MVRRLKVDFGAKGDEGAQLDCVTKCRSRNWRNGFKKMTSKKQGAKEMELQDCLAQHPSAAALLIISDSNGGPSFNIALTCVAKIGTTIPGFDPLHATIAYG